MINIREVSEGDLDSLSDYLPAQPPFLNTTKDTWIRRFRTWWDLNPAYNTQCPMGWIVVSGTQILGFIGNVPLKYCVYGEEQTAAAAVAWYVDPEVRGFFSLRLFSEYLNQTNVAVFLFNSDSKELIRLVEKFGFQEYILPIYQKKYFHILDRRKIFPLLKKMRIIKKIDDFTILINMSVSIMQFFQEFITGPRRTLINQLQAEEYSSSLCSLCDDSFSRIQISSTARCDIVMSRSQKTLNWIYFSPIPPSKRIVIQCKHRREDILAGYMVFDIHRQNSSDVVVMKQMDICIQSNYPDAIRSIVQCAINVAKTNNVSLLEMWACDETTEFFLKQHYPLYTTAQHHNFIKISDSIKHRSGPPVVCPSLIDPPRGIDHF